MPFAALATELAEFEAHGLRRTRRAMGSPERAHVTIDGRDYVAFCSNDYLGLANHPELIAAACEGAARFGVGAGASHLIAGHAPPHALLEEALAAFVGLPRALLFSSGYMANIGVVTALVGRDDAVFADRLNHASLNDGALLSRAEFKRYPHGDTAVLERLLVRTRARRKLVITDAVFSMDGDIADVPTLACLCERHGAWLLLDDAHGFGVLGKAGRGTLAHFGVHSERIVYMATLGKAAGVCGAFVAAAEPVVETLIQRARPYIYTTAGPPLLSHALLTSLELIAREEWRRERLRTLASTLSRSIQPQRWRLQPSHTAIQPLLIGANKAALEASEALAQRSILVPAIRPPTVPPGTARLRISLSAGHSVGDVERLAAALNEIESAAVVFESRPIHESGVASHGLGIQTDDLLR
jgi:8-amino-7-oxononanoate synthase